MLGTSYRCYMGLVLTKFISALLDDVQCCSKHSNHKTDVSITIYVMLKFYMTLWGSYRRQCHPLPSSFSRISLMYSKFLTFTYVCPMPAGAEASLCNQYLQGRLKTIPSTPLFRSKHWTEARSQTRMTQRLVQMCALPKQPADPCHWSSRVMTGMVPCS